MSGGPAHPELVEGLSRSKDPASPRFRVLGVHAGGGIGGAPISLVQLLASLPSAEFESVVAFTEPGAMAQLAMERGLRALVVRAPAAFFYSAHVALGPRTLAPLLLHFRSSVRAAERLLEAERPDLVHLNTSVLLPFAVAARRRNVPVVWHVREVLGPNPWLRHWHAAFIQRHAGAVVATSQAVRACLASPAGVEVVSNAVDLDQYQLSLLQQRAEIRRELGLPTSAPVVAILGSVQRVKGHWLLLEAIARLRPSIPELQALIVAGGVPRGYARSWKGWLKRALGVPLDNLERLQRDAERRGLGLALTCTGFRTDVPRVLAASDALVFPSCRPEGFGRPLIEAMAMARPAIVSDLGPSREIVEPDVSGLLVPADDVGALAEAIGRVLGDAALAERLGRNGRSRVEERFGLARQVDRMVEIYRRVLDRRPVVHARASG